MRVWTLCFVLFFVLAELYQWLEGVVLPLPVFVGAGALLAIASNAGNWKSISTTLQTASVPQPKISVSAERAPTLPPKLANTTGLSNSDTPQLPTVEKRQENPFLKESSISFTVRPPQSDASPDR